MIMSETISTVRLAALTAATVSFLLGVNFAGAQAPAPAQTMPPPYGPMDFAGAGPAQQQAGRGCRPIHLLAAVDTGAAAVAAHHHVEVDGRPVDQLGAQGLIAAEAKGLQRHVETVRAVKEAQQHAGAVQ